MGKSTLGPNIQACQPRSYFRSRVGDPRSFQTILMNISKMWQRSLAERGAVRRMRHAFGVPMCEYAGFSSVCATRATRMETSSNGMDTLTDV